MGILVCADIRLRKSLYFTVLSMTYCTPDSVTVSKSPSFASTACLLLEIETSVKISQFFRMSIIVSSIFEVIDKYGVFQIV